MADLIKNWFGGQPPIPTAALSDDDFADFATAASPAAPSHSASQVFSGATYTPTSIGTGFFGSPYGMQNRPFTKWYRIWERVTIHDFYQEMLIVPILIFVIIINYIGAGINRRKVKQWAGTYLPLLEGEYASVGFGASPETEGMQVKGLREAIEESREVPEELLKQKRKNEFFTYATGRQNVAWLDVKLTLYKRFNPVIWFFEAALAFFLESMPSPEERMEATAYCFDGREKTIAPEASNVGNSGYDGFVWAVVHKDKMKQLRDDRYDLSLTATRDHPKLPDYVTVMSESAEVTETLVTAELVKAIEEAGEDLEALIISDMPIDAPKKLNELLPKKRISLAFSLSHQPTTNTTPLFTYFLRLPDTLVSSAHFRAEALRKIKSTRDEEMRKIKKLDEDEKAEERKSTSDKVKKEERERRLKGMSAEEQRKFLEREAEVERRKGMKKRTMKA